MEAVVELSAEVHRFSSACEHLLAGIAIHRPLTDEEKRLIQYYCNELHNQVTAPGLDSKLVNSNLSSDPPTSE